MRIPIAVQLALLVLLTTLSGIAVLAIATWITTYNFVVGVESQGLELVATIKASQIASNLELIEVTCKTISTRLLVQAALERYNNGNTSATNWVNSISDIQSALGSRGYLDLYQASLYSSQGEGSTGDGRLLNVTSDTVPQINLPYTYENGTAVTLGDSGLGYPPALYPNVTYTTSQEGNATVVQAFPDYTLGLTSALLLGPLTVNDSFSLVSLTVPIINNTSTTDILGYLTVVASAVNVQNVLSSRDGMGDTGQVLLLGPSRAQNTFASDAQPATATSSPDTAGLEAALVHYVFEPTTLPKQTNRHPNVSTSDSFSLSKYKIALKLMLESYGSRTSAIHDLSTKNEKGYTVAVGAIRPETSLVEWILLVEESHDEAFHPVFRLRKIIIGCVFGTAGLIILIIPLMARWAVAPIRRLREAAKKSVIPEFSPEPPMHHGRNIFGISNRILAHGNDQSVTEKGPSFLTRRLRAPSEQAGNLETVTTQHPQRDFQVPSRVKERRNCITDELTDLTRTFNEMSDELTIQYNRLEERVIERTRELEKAKLAAETANESKTLFIANISHELKTPLNGILGMCAVCMGEDDLSRIKRSLKVVYQSGDLLLHLLNDLLTFSKNQIDQAIQLDEKEFRLSDIRAQLGIIFQKQVHEKQIDFNIHYTNTEIQGPETVTETFCLDPDSHVGLPLKPVHGRLMDMVLLGDQHRILQVLINLVSNSLKFTPENGKVDVWIRCLGESSQPDGPTAFNHDTRGRLRQKSRSLDSQISALEQSKSVNQTTGKDLFGEPPYGRALMFEFEVRDNGPGIPRNLHRRIFDPFVQGDLGLNRKYGGTGLGLSICAQLSRIMNGTILLESEEGKGSTFTLRIPLGFVKELAPSSQFSSNAGSRSPSPLSLEFATVARPSTQGSTKSEPVAAPSFEKADGQPRLVGLSQPFFAPTVPPSPQSASSVSTPRNIQPGANGNSPRRIRVLVAEDNTVNQEVVRRMLALEEVYDVTMVKDGQEAYDIVRLNMETGSVFDLIFMDIQMPNLDGLQSTRLIREMGYSAPIVALSAFAEESNKKDCIESGMDMFISKPIRRPALKQVLNKFATIIEESEPGLAE